MAYNGKAKLKILYLQKILQEETDTDHGLTMSQIIERLAEYGISAERKSIYSDLNALREFDIDVRTFQRSPVEYAIEKRDFSIGELMLMVDAIQSCRAITERQSRMLITNVKTLASNHEQEKLDRRIHVVGRIKSKNDSVFGNIDDVHEALRMHCKISFLYYRRNAEGERYASHDGKPHVVSPVGVTYEDGFYYLTGWDDDRDAMAEFRIDRMGRIKILEETVERNDEMRNHTFDDEGYEAFGHFNGEKMTVTLAVAPEKVEIVFDRFGNDAIIGSRTDDRVNAHVKVKVSEQFFGWVAGLGGTLRIAGPQRLVDEYRAYLRKLLDES